MNSRTSWERGGCEMEWIRVSSYGEVFVALDKSSYDHVVIKKVKTSISDSGIESESRLLKECQSRFIVRYYNVVRREGELWVRDDEVR